MANDLEKLADVTFTAGTPARPYQPAREVVYTSGSYEVAYTSSVITYTDPYTGEQATKLSLVPTVAWVDTSRVVVIPAVPARPATPPTVSSNALLGWNSSAVSITSLRDDGGWRFTVPTTTAGAIVGLAQDNAYTTPNTVEHGVYVTFGSVSVWEAGKVVATGYTNDGGPIVVLRNNGVVTLSGTDWSYTSATTSTGERVLDAALYAAGDTVADPQPVAYVELLGAYPAPRVQLADSAGYTSVTATFPSPVLTITGAVGRIGDLTMGYPPPVARLSDGGGYAGLDLVLPAPALATEGGLPVIPLASLFLPAPMAGIALAGLAGRVGNVALTLPAPTTKLADAGGYSDLQLQVPGASLIMVARPVKPWATCYAGPTAFAAVARSSGAQRTALTAGTMTFAPATCASVQTQGASIVAGAFSAAAALSAALTGAATLVAGTLATRGTAITNAQTHTTLCTNMATGAVTRFSGFDFAGYTLDGADAVAWDASGVYVIGDHPRTADVVVAFGDIDMGTNQSKSVPMVLVAAATDVPPQVTLNTPMADVTYGTFSVGSMWRASTGKGVVARNWGVEVSVTGATAFSLEAVEIQYAPLWRKGIAR